jgi:arabinan endo-1,5-alpha-L-arabinosidase
MVIQERTAAEQADVKGYEGCMPGEWKRAWVWVVLLFACAAASIGQQPGSDEFSGATRGIHDPSIIKAGDTWYVFGTGGRPDGPQMPIRCSTDLHFWTQCGHVLDRIPDWIRARLPGVRDLWAPDISFVDGQYRLYYVYSLLGKNTSGIALLTNKTLDQNSPDYGWVDQGPVIESRAGDDYNTIDPNFISDAKGGDWLVFGSYWSGIKMRELGPDGKLSPKNAKLYSLAKRVRPPGGERIQKGAAAPWEAIEAPFMVHHGSYFYLFTSWDFCCRGANSTYHVMVGRSAKVTGPFVDESGKKLMKGGGTEILAGNSRWAGPGGESLWMGPDDQDVMVFHAYDRTSGRPYLQVSSVHWVGDWPQVSDQPVSAGANKTSPSH